MGEGVNFEENKVYTVEQAAKILQRSEKTVRGLCRKKLLQSRSDRGGYFITGWAIRAYCENRVLVK